MHSLDELLAIPGLSHGDSALVQSLLTAADIPFTIGGRGRQTGSQLLIRTSDLATARELLADFRVRNSNGELIPIPW